MDARWDVQRRPGFCARCGEPLGAGEQVRLVTTRNWRYCVACAARVFPAETPPAEMPVRRVVDDLDGFARFRAPASVVARLDGKARQVGSE